MQRFAFLGIALLAVSESSIAGDTPIVHWTFDASLKDSTGRYPVKAVGCDQDSITLIGAERIPGILGRALPIGTLGAAAMFTIDMNAELKPDAEYTLEAWIIPVRTDGWRRLVLLWGNSPDYAYHLALHDGKASLAHGQADGDYVIAEGGLVAANILHHIVGIADGTQLRVYLNGRHVDDQPYDGTIGDTGTMSIGVGDSSVIRSADSSFQGYLDELCIYDRALSAEEVRDHFLSAERSAAVVQSRRHQQELEHRQLASGLTEDEPLLCELLARGVEQIVLARRGPGRDVQKHYYANFGHSAIRPEHWLHAADGGQLIALGLRHRNVDILLDDPAGNVRDPCVHYDGRRILFSYRKGGTHHYNLYTINADGTGLTQLSDGPWDDVEACWLPDGGIAFCSTRCMRYIGCWIAPSAILFRCDENGQNMRMLSTSPFSDNTPCVLPDGRILYTRWEYVNRDPVVFHHLWTMNPDGSSVAAFLGNMKPGGVFIDACPIPDSDKIVFIHSPGHGRNEHVGRIATFCGASGPNNRTSFHEISDDGFRDPCPLGDGFFLAANENRIVVVREKQTPRTLFTAPDMLHEPVWVRSRPRERVIPSRIDVTQSTGTILLTEAHRGRNMAGVKPGDVKKLLVLEDLPKPVNVHGGGSQPVGHGVTSTLKRILGSVPVEADGSAYFTVPSLRSIYFGLLDEEERCIKQMRSFTTVQPGEHVSCIGCHEERTTTADRTSLPDIPEALKRGPSEIQPFADVSDVLDFPRDVQPILDRHCVECHNPDRRAGGVELGGDHGPVYSMAYYNLYLHWQIKDTVGAPRHGSGRQLGNDPPWTTFSYASDFMNKVDGSHHDVNATNAERRLLRLWIDTGAAYAGTYACYASGQIGDVGFNNLPVHELADDWPSTSACVGAIERRCGGCHDEKLLPRHVTARTQISGWGDFLSWTRPLSRYSRHRIFNLSRPKKSLALTLPLAEGAGGAGTEPLGPAMRVAENFSQPPAEVKHPIVFETTEDLDYQAILTHIQAAGARLREIKRFDMPGFRPGEEYLREMRRYGVLPPASEDDGGPIDPYDADRRYWNLMYPDKACPLPVPLRSRSAAGRPSAR
jgi:hypothetical protein